MVPNWGFNDCVEDPQVRFLPSKKVSDLKPEISSIETRRKSSSTGKKHTIKHTYWIRFQRSEDAKKICISLSAISVLRRNQRLCKCWKTSG